MLDFGFEWHQDELRKTLRQYLDEHSGIEALKAADHTTPGYSPAAYRGLADLGVFQLWRRPGGTDDLVDLMVVFEELGWAALPGPQFTSAVVAAHLAADLGDPGTAEALLAGTRIATLALHGEAADFGPTGVEIVADARGLHGRNLFVPYADSADETFVLAREVDRLSFFRVPRGAAGVRMSPLHTMSGEPQFELELDGVRAERLGESGAGWRALERILPLAQVLQAAELVGIAGRALEIAVEYSKVRIAFGKPIGSYQAIQHMEAEMLADRDAARVLTYQGVALLNAGILDERVWMAKPFAAAAARRVTKNAHQILAGHGFVLENRLNHYYRRAKAIELALGDTDHSLGVIADLVAPISPPTTAA